MNDEIWGILAMNDEIWGVLAMDDKKGRSQQEIIRIEQQTGREYSQIL